MKYVYMIGVLAATLICTNAFAQHASPKTPVKMPVVAQQQELLMDCNLAARNSLISGDIKRVEDMCTKAMNVMEESYPDRGYMINPMLNLAFTYSLIGDFDKADPLLARAKKLGEKFFKPESSEMKSINDLIEDYNKRKGKPAQFDKSGVSSPH
ncbi:MAG TPA: tetratricopeptide repeat protein [Nitrospirae bacterium]|nr:tetratricopeptide repeat protein [Nitrospirota bacterium]